MHPQHIAAQSPQQGWKARIRADRRRHDQREAFDIIAYVAELCDGPGFHARHGGASGAALYSADVNTSGAPR